MTAVAPERVAGAESLPGRGSSHADGVARFADLAHEIVAEDVYRAGEEHRVLRHREPMAGAYDGVGDGESRHGLAASVNGNGRDVGEDRGARAAAAGSGARARCDREEEKAPMALQRS